jgi:hypothetical protein
MNAVQENLEKEFRVRRDKVYNSEALSWEKKMRELLKLRREFDYRIREASEAKEEE